MLVLTGFGVLALLFVLVRISQQLTQLDRRLALSCPLPEEQDDDDGDDDDGEALPVTPNHRTPHAA